MLCQVPGRPANRRLRAEGANAHSRDLPIGDTMFNPPVKIAFLILVGCLVSSCAPIKETGRTIGHTTRDVTREIGHGARDVTREIGHGTRDVAREIGEGTRDAAKAVGEGAKKVVKPTSETSDY
jgi:hypothetical protein